MFFKGHYLDTISKADVERFRRYLKEMGYAPGTINKNHMILARIYSKMEEYKEGRFLNGTDLSRLVLPPKNPAALVPKVNERPYARQVFITKKQKINLCGYADEDLAEIIDTLYWSQLRPGDLFRISDKNVDTNKWVLFGIQHKHITTRNPSGTPYRVPVPEIKREMILRRLKDTKLGIPIFRYRNLQKRWKRVRELASERDPYLRTVQLRDLRASANSYLLDQNTDMETLRKKAGWTTQRMVSWYDKRPDDRVVEATNKLVEA